MTFHSNFKFCTFYATFSVVLYKPFGHETRPANFLLLLPTLGILQLGASAFQTVIHRIADPDPSVLGGSGAGF